MSYEVKLQPGGGFLQPLMHQEVDPLGRATDGLEFDQLVRPPDAPAAQETWWQRWRVSVCAVGGFGASLAVRILAYSRVSNAFSSLGTGFFASAVVNSCYKGKNVEQVRKIGLTLCGTVPVFFLSQLWANSQTMWVQSLATHMIIGCLGANIQMFAQWMYEKGGAIRVESHAFLSDKGLRLKECCPSWYGDTTIHVLKLVAAGTAGALYFTFSDPVSQGIFAFWSFFYGCQVVGEKLSTWVDRKIEETDSNDPSLAGANGSRYRTLKTVLNTLGFFAIPVSFIPWTTDPHTAARVAQLFVIGVIIGFFDGFMYQSLNTRLRNFPVKFLEEFNKLKVPAEAKANGCSPFRYVAYQVWRVAVPILAIGGLVAFTVWQECYVLSKVNSKDALGSMLGGFLGTFALSNIVDWTWDPDKRHYLKDKLMSVLLIAPRIFGINPLYVYFVGTNALAMDSTEIEKGESSFHMAMIITSWVAYGAAMALELQRTWGMRVGTLFYFPMKVIVDAAITMKLSIAGEGGVN